VAGQICRQLTRAYIPDLQSSIFGGRDEQTRVSRERALVDGADVAAEGRDEPGAWLVM
jgi:hypothetical protein